MAPRNNPDDVDFVNVWFDDETGRQEKPPVAHKKQDFYDQWVEQSSAKHSSPELYGANALRNLYPTHSLVMSEDARLNLLSYPHVKYEPLPTTQSVTNVVFVPIARRLGGVKGVINESVIFGAFNVTWKEHSFILYTVRYGLGMSVRIQHYILHDGPEAPARELLFLAGVWQNQTHDEIWVFNQGFWSKDRGLWAEVQKANWDEVVLKDDFKKALQKDIYGFFESEEIYEQLSIPWKRGIIMYGPPGNGKTISIKAIMKTCAERDFSPLYVKSFQSWKGEEGAMQDVFAKAREVAPCVLVLEDLDSLINDRNRSFFLNQIDGLEGNDGLLVIGSTNHFEKLDPALSSRPSRFDRKYLFDDPDYDERVLYIRFWQNKLKTNKDIPFPDSLEAEVATATEGFSYAYLKEAFVTTLVLLAHDEDNKVNFASILLQQIASLRKELKKKPNTTSRPLPIARDIFSMQHDLMESLGMDIKNINTSSATPATERKCPKFVNHATLDCTSPEDVKERRETRMAYRTLERCSPIASDSSESLRTQNPWRSSSTHAPHLIPTSLPSPPSLQHHVTSASLGLPATPKPPAAPAHKSPCLCCDRVTGLANAEPPTSPTASVEVPSSPVMPGSLPVTDTPTSPSTTKRWRAYPASDANIFRF